MKQELDKCVLVIDEAMPRGLAANTAAILGITWGRLRPELVGGFPKKGKDFLEVEILGESKKILVGADDKDEIEIKIKKEICAPIKKGTVIGEIVYRVNGERIISYEVVAGKTVKERTLWICAEYLRRKFLL